MKNEITINDFSPHLFWDVDRSKLDFSKTKEQIVYNVVEYGLMRDWELLQRIYTKEELKKIVMSLRVLDKKTLAYLSHFFNLSKEKFRCYTQNQLTPNFWDL